MGRSIEQTAIEVSLMQLAAGGLPVRRRRKYRRHEKRLLTIKESMRRATTLSVNLIIGCHFSKIVH